MEKHKASNGDKITYAPNAVQQIRRGDETWNKLLLQPGEIGLFEDQWWLCCTCGAIGVMDHEVTLNGDKVTVTPSVVCPSGCHYFIQDGVVTGA